MDKGLKYNELNSHLKLCFLPPGIQLITNQVLPVGFP